MRQKVASREKNIGNPRAQVFPFLDEDIIFQCEKNIYEKRETKRKHFSPIKKVWWKLFFHLAFDTQMHFPIHSWMEIFFQVQP